MDQAQPFRDELTQKLSELELKIISKQAKASQAIYDLGVNKAESMNQIKSITGQLCDIVSSIEQAMTRELDQCTSARREHVKRMDGQLSIFKGEVIELQCNMEEQDLDFVVSKISRLQFQLDQGSFDTNDACTDLTVNLCESLKSFLKQRTDTFFTVGKSYLPELLKLRVTSASESEIRLELQASKSDKLPERLWRDIHVEISSQGELLFGPTLLDGMLENNQAVLVGRDRVEITLAIVSSSDVLVQVTRGSDHVRGSPQAVCIDKVSLWTTIGHGKAPQKASDFSDLDQSDINSISIRPDYTANLSTIREEDHPEQETGKNPYQEILSANQSFIQKHQMNFTTCDRDQLLESTMNRTPVENDRKVNSSNFRNDESLLKTGSQTLIDQIQDKLSGPFNDTSCQTFTTSSDEIFSTSNAAPQNVALHPISTTLLECSSKSEDNSNKAEEAVQAMANRSSGRRMGFEQTTTEEKDQKEGAIDNDVLSSSNPSEFYEEIEGKESEPIQGTLDYWKALPDLSNRTAKLDSVSGPTWDDQDYSHLVEIAKGLPEFDLSSPCFSFLHQKVFDFNSESSNKVLVLPQGVARDPYLNVTYISDIGSNKIHYYKGWTYKSIWPCDVTFSTPRYVMTVPSIVNPDQDKTTGMDVVVLDNFGLHLLKSSGEKQKTFFEGSGHKFRGLTFDPINGWIVTSQKIEGKGVELVFIVLSEKKQSDRSEVHEMEVQDSEVEAIEMKRILLTPTCLTGFHMVKSLCRFLAYHDRKIYTTDLGLGCYYVTDTRTDETIPIRDTDNLTKVTGIAVDPAGNIIMSAYGEDRHSHIHVYSKENRHVRTIDNLGEELCGITGMVLEGRSLYLADITSKVVHVLVVIEKSPKKLVQNLHSSIVVPIQEMI